MNRSHTAIAMLVTACGCSVCAQPTIPAEFESAAESLDRLFTLGGVGSFQVSPSTEQIYDGGSSRLDIAYNSSGFFSFSTAGLGVTNPGTAGFNVDPAADTFSITVRTPSPALGGLELIVALRDDDNNDGEIDIGSDDDEWIATIPLVEGLAIYNVPLTDFEDANPQVGNDSVDFASGPVGGMVLSFQTSTALPGGRIEQPVSIWIDHVGAYAGSQTLPDGNCLADVNGDGLLNGSDFFAWVAAFGQQDPAADQNQDGVINGSDFFAWVAAFGTGC